MRIEILTKGERHDALYRVDDAFRKIGSFMCEVATYDEILLSNLIDARDELDKAIEIIRKAEDRQGKVEQ